MQLGYVGINYKNTDLSVRDKITFTDSGKQGVPEQVH